MQMLKVSFKILIGNQRRENKDNLEGKGFSEVNAQFHQASISGEFSDLCVVPFIDVIL